MNKLFCDNCGVEINKNQPDTTTRISLKNRKDSRLLELEISFEFLVSHWGDRQPDLCPNCFAEIAHSILLGFEKKLTKAIK